MPEIQMPKLSDTMTEGTLVAWKKKKGDKVSSGEVLAEIETDKATMEWESPEDGVLTEIYVPEGGKVNVGDRIGFIGTEGEEAPKQAVEAPVSGAKGRPTVEAGVSLAKERPTRPLLHQDAEPPAGRPLQTEPRVKASPVARRIAGELGVDLAKVKGTGPDGRVTETDVRTAARAVEAPVSGAKKGPSVGTSVSPARKPSAPRPLPRARGEVRIQLSGMRRVIAQRLVESLGPVPHFYLNIEIDAGPLMAVRAELKAGGEESDTARITVNDFVLKAAVEAAVKVPKVNASFDGDSLVQYADVDLGIAVAIEDGLLTPVIRAAQTKSLREISAVAKDLASRARNKRMKPEEFQGGTFTVSNLGGMGIDRFSAVINPPQGFILAVGKITKVPMADDCDQIVVGHRMSITMSCDHRVVDGALGAEYLKELRRLLENPALLMV
jgi:pyruvate dehydrogenase E2 component (dihydrolipoamide acetyltransferase)